MRHRHRGRAARGPGQGDQRLVEPEAIKLVIEQMEAMAPRYSA
ncbi:MAG TPA: hypothetical protein VEL73_08485 [Mycobacteriales bacterium]|nr:hypothetical protein [Mycobacteriales bacterium]